MTYYDQTFLVVAIGLTWGIGLWMLWEVGSNVYHHYMWDREKRLEREREGKDDV